MAGSASDTAKGTAGEHRAREQVARICAHLLQQGLIDQRSNWRIEWLHPPDILICRIWSDSDSALDFWAIGGKVPIDALPLRSASTVRDALRHFALRWHAEAARLQGLESASAGAVDWPARGARLAEQAELLYALYQREELWPDSRPGEPAAHQPGDGRCEHWSRYWASGALHSCHNAFPANYEGAIRRRWERLLGELPRGARVLDVATGNGGLAFLARDFSRARDLEFEIHAIDLARIDPGKATAAAKLASDGVSFRAGVPMEATGYPDGYFDAVIGQYALEYGDSNATTAELARIVRRRSHAAFLLHHPESIIAETARAELDHLAFLEQSGALSLALELLAQLGDAQLAEELAAARSAGRTEPLRNELNRATERLTERIRSMRYSEVLSVALGHIARAFALRKTAGQLAVRRQLEQFSEELTASTRRLEDLLSVALRREQLQALGGMFETHGFRCRTLSEVRMDDGALMGWFFHAVRETDRGSA